MKEKKRFRRCAAALGLFFCAAVASAQETPIPTLDEILAAAKNKREWIETPYSVIDGKVDICTYRGWRQFHAVCHTCHGPDALGSTIAPDLTAALAGGEVPYPVFAETIYNGREKDGAQVMLAFGVNRDVLRNLDNLYAYLRARADGALIRRGRPQRQKEKGADCLTVGENK
jgi:mono/diheme cytochrome c family protein